MTAHESEAADDLRLKKSAEFVDHCKQEEAEALRALSDSRARLGRAREKHAQLFEECEKRACARRVSGQIEAKAGY